MSEATAGIVLPFPHADSFIALRPAMQRARFEAIINQLVAQLQARGCTHAALWFDDSALFSCALLGCWAAGVRVLLAPDLLGDTCSWVQTDAQLWISDQALAHAAIPVLRLDAVDVAVSEPAAPAGARSETDRREALDTPPRVFRDHAQGLFLPLPANAQAFLRTSGSSGVPRIIRKTFGQLQAEALTLIDTWSLHALPATLIASVGHQHMYGLTFRIMVPLHAGLTLDRMQSRYPETLAEQTLMYDQCIWITSPALLQRLPDSLPWPALLPRLARVVSAGGALAERTRATLLQRHWPLHEIYGSTETGVIATRHVHPSWTPLPGVALQTDTQDRLAVSSPWTDGIEQTADVISRSDENSFTLLGRADRILKLEDKRISLNRIEQSALSHSYVRDIHCAPSPLGGRLCAMVELSPAGVQAFRQHGRRHLILAISDLLRESIDTLAIPRHWRFPTVLPRNAQSKITRQQVHDCFTQPLRSPQWDIDHADSTAQSLQAQACVQYDLTATVPIDLVYFSGHFPTFPLVPGVVQLGWALEQARARNLCRGEPQGIENLKFQHFLRPADPCSMTLKWDNDKRKLYFSMRTGATMTASGRIAFAVSA